MWCICFSALTILWILIHSVTVDGFMQRCDVNQTIFVSEGSSVTFHTEAIAYYRYGEVLLTKYNTLSTGRRLIRGLLFWDSPIEINDTDLFYKDRLNVEVAYFEERRLSINITVNASERADNGSYVLEVHALPNPRYWCWILFVMDIARQPPGPIEEYEPAYFYAEPKASVVVRPLSNASMLWLVDSKNVTESPQFVLQDGKIWVASVRRTLDGRNITYRALQDSGEVNEVNYTIKVMYGPEAPLEFSPVKEHYFLSSGQSMPDVSCSVECNPPCNVSWDSHSKGNILSLGTVSTAMTGIYTCTARRPGTSITVKRSLVIQVEAFTIAIAVVASIQAITTIILVLCGIFIYRRSNGLPCQRTDRYNLRDDSGRKTLSGYENNGKNINETELEHHGELDSQVRPEQHLVQYEQIAIRTPGITKPPDEPVEKHSPAYFCAYPKASAIHRPVINATMMWLVDGKNITQTPLFVIQDGMVWLANVPRTLNGRNVTYRVVQDDGLVTEVNYTIEVLYGPQAPLEFSPDTEHFFITSGHVMPEVSCSVNCSQSCQVSWNTRGTGNILSLGKVSTSLTGTYTCTATRTGSDVLVKRRLFVQVEDSSTFTIAVAVLASIQVVTTIILVLCGILIYRRGNASLCESSSKSSTPHSDGSRKALSGHKSEGGDINETVLEHYEELDSENRTVHHLEQYELVKTPGKTAGNMYVNTKIS